MISISRFLVLLVFLSWCATFLLVEGFVAPHRLTTPPRGHADAHRNFRMALAQTAVHDPGTMALAGKLFSNVRRLFIGKAELKAIGAAIAHASHPGDLAILFLLGFGAIPVTRFMRGLRLSEQTQDTWHKSISFRIARSVSQLSAIGAIVYAVDMLAVALKTINFHFPFRMSLSHVTGQICFSVLVAKNIAAIKSELLCRMVKSDSIDEAGRARLYGRLLNAVIAFSTLMIILDILSVETGRTIGSLFAIGGVGTVVISLASKDIAADFVSGLALSASMKFHEGEEVRIGAENPGHVHRMGWMNTAIRGHDEKISTIPNSKIAKEKVQNISRISRSQVKQHITFDYEDIDKIPSLLDDIKNEIESSCPKLVSDGSRPFWVHWREFKEDNLEVVVDTHFKIRHGTTEYYDTRQQVLLAIAKAAKKNGVKFAIPLLSLRSEPGVKPDDIAQQLSQSHTAPTSSSS